MLLKGPEQFLGCVSYSSLQDHSVVVFGSMLSHGTARMYENSPAIPCCRTLHHCPNEGGELWVSQSLMPQPNFSFFLIL